MPAFTLKGHERPITQLRFTPDGEILAASSKDKFVSLWFAHSGEMMALVGPHDGAVTSIDFGPDSRFMLSACAAQGVYLWDVHTGEKLFTKTFPSNIMHVQIAPNSTQERTVALLVQGDLMGQVSCVYVYEFETSDLHGITAKELRRIEHPKRNTFTKATWVFDSRHIIAAFNNGYVARIDSETGDFLCERKIHKETIVDIQPSADSSYFVTASRDSTAVMLPATGDLDAFEVSYRGDVPLNSAAIAPVKDIVIAGGGISARDVTTSSGGKFDVHFFHKLFADDLARVGGHFGPINAIAFHPDGTGYASGSEDGYVRLNTFDKNYFDFDYAKLMAH